MRINPRTLEDFIYLISKIGLSPLRGLFLWIFLSNRSNIPFLGAGTKVISAGKIHCGKLVWIGQGCYIDACSEKGVELGDGVTLRERGTIQCRSGLNPPGIGLIIGSGTFIGPNFKIGVGGMITIGKNCQFGAYSSLNAESHLLGEDGAYTSGKTQRKGIVIGDNVWVGDGVIILDGVTVGTGSVIGAGSVVVADIPDAVVAAGSPARILRAVGARKIT